MHIRTIMSEPVISIAAKDTIAKAAELMRRHAIGILPVLDGWRPVGIVTDRDIVVQAINDRHDARNRPVSDVMSTDPVSCQSDQTVTEAAAIMGDEQVRRVLVLDKLNRLVGVLSVGDIARDASEELAGQVLGEITELRKRVVREQ